MAQSEQVTAAAPTARIRELDSLRGLAAVIVARFHFTTVFDEKWGRPRGWRS